MRISHTLLFGILWGPTHYTKQHNLKQAVDFFNKKISKKKENAIGSSRSGSQETLITESVIYTTLQKQMMPVASLKNLA